MVKDNLTDFHTACDTYNECTRWQAIKVFFKGVPNPNLYWFLFVVATLMIFSSILTGVLFKFIGTDQKNSILLSIIGLISGVAIFYFYLLKKHGVGKEKTRRYQRLLTYTFYQYERYFMFKDGLHEIYKHKDFPFDKVKELIQTRLQQDQGLAVFRIWLVGVCVSLLITIIFSLAPSAEEGKELYIAIVSFYLLLSLLFTYAMHDPFWFKGNRYRELLLFITLYESDSVLEYINEE